MIKSESSQNNNSLPVNPESLLRQINLLVSRLERLSADSVFAHQASGFRGGLLREAEKIRENVYVPEVDILYIQKLIEASYQILYSAAKDLS